jgi:hemerythrin-like domain-containing protein
MRRSTTSRKKTAAKAKTPRRPTTNSRARSRTASLAATAQAVGRVLGETAAAVAERVRAGRGTDAISLLETDHRRLESLLDAGEKTTSRAGKRRTELLETITRELTAHELIEEKVLYPTLKSHPEAKDIVLEGYQEHHVADLVLDELQGLRTSDERWGAKFKVFKENIEHHIEEEEGDMFKTARRLLSDAQLEELGARMQTMKTEALKQME